MLNYLKQILNEGEGNDYTQEQYEKSQRDVRKVKLMLKHIRPDKGLCCFYIVAFPSGNEIKVFPIFTALYTPHTEFQRIKKKIESVLPKNIKVWEWMGGGVDCDVFKEMSKKIDNFKTESSYCEFVFPEHKDEELTEKWSQKYKRSIDCDSPKGFSQRAHCQGKKKKDLDEYGRTLKMARRQGAGTRFPKSAIKANPGRFRNYTREMNEESLKYLDKVVELCRLLNEEKKPDFEWEFEVKKNVDKSLDWVKTKNQAISYIKTLYDKIKNVSDNIKHKILRYVIYSFVGLFTIAQMNNMYDGLTKEKPNLKKIENIGGGGEEKKEQKIRDYDESLVKHMKYEEGSITDKGEPVLTAYDIGDGAKTIGYGHAIFSSESRGSTGGDYPFLPKYNKIIVGKTKITKKQAEELLRDDLDKSKKELNKILDKWEKDGITPGIDQDMYNAMVSMIFNMGVGNFRTSEFIQYVKKNQMDKAKEQIKKESSKSFRKFPGLKDRREREANMFGGEPLNESKNRNTDAAKFLFRRVIKEETSLKTRMLDLINSEGLLRTSQRVNGIERLSKILKETPETLLNKYIKKETFSTDDVGTDVGGYDFKFRITKVKENDDKEFEFYFLIEEGTVDLIMIDGGEYDLLGPEVRDFNDWWEITFEIKDILGDFLETFTDKLKLKVNSIKIYYAFKGEESKEFMNEETERSNKDIILEKQVKKMIDHFTKDIEFPENFYDFMVDIINDKKYDEKILKVTTVMKKPFSEGDSNNLDVIRRKFMSKIRPMFESKFDRFSFGSTSTLEVYNKDKDKDFYY